MSVHSSNILHIIAECLTFKDLCTFAQASRTTHSVACRPEHWKREFYRLFTSNLEFFGELVRCPDSGFFKGSEPEWRSLVERGVRQRRSWTDLAAFNYLCVDDLQMLADDFFETLRDPQLPLPKLRREGVCLLNTTLQEMLADACQSEPDQMCMPSLTASVVQQLDNFFTELLDEFDVQTKIDQLLIARWNLRRPKATKFDLHNTNLLSSTASTLVTVRSTYDESSLENTYINFPLKEAEPFLLRLYNTLKTSSSFYCKVYGELLKCHGELVEMSSHYVITWNAFCGAISKLDADYKAFSLLVNDVSNTLQEDMPKCPQFSIMRLMVIQWRRKVFAPLKESLLQAILYLIERQRNHLLSTYNGHKSFCVQKDIQGLGSPLQKRQHQVELTLLSKLVQSFLDLSLNENSVHFTGHTQLYTDGPYSGLQQRVSSASYAFYNSLSDLPPDILSTIMHEDVNMIKTIFIPSSAVEVERMKLGFEMEAWRNFFVQTYLNYKPNSHSFILNDDIAFALTNSPFGQALFRVQPLANATLKIRQFIEYLNALSPKFIPAVSHYNECDELQETLKRKQPQDIEIDEFNEDLSLSMDLSAEERMLHSLSEDLNPVSFEIILKEMLVDEVSH